VTGMVYSLEPRALVRTDGTAGDLSAGAGRNLYRAQKANRLSMSRGSLFPSSVLFASFPGPGNRCLRRLVPGFLVVGAAVAMVTYGSPAQAQTAGTWSKRGAEAEVREDYDAAYEDYKKAHDKKPKDLRYLAHFERMRFLAATQHIDRGRLLRQQGDYAGAIQQFMRAGQIDASNQAAQQEIERTQRDQPAAGVTGAAAVAAAEQMSQQRQVLNEIKSIAGPIELKPVSNEPITLHMVEDVKVIYQAIGKVAGLNILFDPNYTSKRIPIDLTNVSLSEALRIVGIVSGTFFKPVTSNTVFVAQNTRTNRTEMDELAVQTFYLSNASQPNDGNEILTGLRLMLDPSVKLYLVPSQNAIVVRAPIDQLLLAEKLINDFDRARPEVVVDVAVLEVNRDKIRNLGITLPTSIGLAPQLPTTSTTAAGTTPSPTTGSSLTLSNLTHLNSNDFAVSISGGTLNALLSDTDTRVLQNPRIRATDGQRATLKIGQKIPVATGSYNAGVSTGAASIGVQTQFTYLDVGVNIDITPTVHYDREVSLKTKVEVSQQNGSVTISGVTEPIIAQRVLEQVIQLKDGEPSILAGIVTKQDNKSVSGTPGLGELPFFKYFFSSQNKEVQQDEIVFLLIPHIVRESVLTRTNLRVIDTGTGTSVELRREDPAVMKAGADLQDPGLVQRPVTETTAAAAAAAAVQQMHQSAMPAQMPQAMPPQLPPQMPGQMPQAAITTAPASAAAPGAFGVPVTVKIIPSSSDQKVGSTFQAVVMLTDGKDISSAAMQVKFNPSVLQLVNVDGGGLLAQGLTPDQDQMTAHHLDASGLVTIASSRPPKTKGVTGQGSVCVLVFKAIGAGDSDIAFTKVGAKDSNQSAVPANGMQAVVHVQ
jgi:general secretion pathway protein D